jgi:hypothetical protein
MSEQTCGTCGQPGRTVPLTVEGQVVGESVLHENDDGIVTHNVMYPRDGGPPELPEGSGFSFRVPDIPDEPVPWSRALPGEHLPALDRFRERYLTTRPPPGEPDEPHRVLRDVQIQWMSLDLEPGPYQAIPEAAGEDEEGDR